MPAFEQSQVLSAGTHYLEVAEREDGSLLRHVEMTEGYPACTFGEAPPTSSDLAARMLQIETLANNRVSGLEGTVNNLTVLVNELSTASTPSNLAVAIPGRGTGMEDWPAQWFQNSTSGASPHLLVVPL